MGGASTTLKAPTIAELQEKVEHWYAEAEGAGLEDARAPWDPKDARKTDDGYEFTVWAHS